MNTTTRTGTFTQLLQRAAALALTALLTTAVVAAPSHATTDEPELLTTTSEGEEIGTPDVTEDPKSPPVPPGDITPLGSQPRLDVAATCTTPQGFTWEMVYPDAPVGAFFAAQHREAPDGEIVNLPLGDSSGFVAADNGTHQVRGVITIGGDTVLHEYGWVDVTVHCLGLKPSPPSEPTVTVTLGAVCQPDAGVEFAIEVTSPPAGNTATVAQWRDEHGGYVGAEDGPTGFLPTGEGTYEVRGVLHHQGPGFYSSDWQEITVSCDGRNDDEPEDAPRRGVPTFTG